MATDGTENSRARVQTYVPEYQKEEWNRHAEELDMSLSEFLRSMVQAGRHGFEPDETGRETEDGGGEPFPAGEPQGSELEKRVRSILAEEEYADWDQLLAAMTEGIETRLEETLQTLQDDGDVRYSGRHGGYVLE